MNIEEMDNRYVNTALNQIDLKLNALIIMWGLLVFLMIVVLIGLSAVKT